MAGWSDWEEVEEDGTIPEELLPASRWQYKWMIHHEFSIGWNWLQAGQGSITMTFRTKFGEHQLADVAKFSFYSQKDPLDPFVTGQYTYWLGSGITTREAGTATRPGGATTGQVAFMPTGTTWAFGVTEGFFYGELIGDVWVGDLYGDDVVDFVNWYPCLYIPHGKSLWIRTQGGDAPVQTVLDPVTHNKHEFWTYRSQLLTRRQLNRDGTWDGKQWGCTLAWVGTGTAQRLRCYIGQVVLEQRAYLVAEADLDPGGSCLVVVKLVGDEAVPELVYDGDVTGAHCCIGRVDGSTISQVAEQCGTIISRDCDEFSAWIEDTGRLVCNVGAVSARVQRESRDRGASWVTVTA